MSKQERELSSLPQPGVQLQALQPCTLPVFALPEWMGAGESELWGAIYRTDTHDIMPRAHKCTCKLASL